MVNCPEWSEDIPPERQAEFRPILDLVHGIIAEAATKLIDEQDPKDWHFRLFQSFVPLDYYAGHFRQNHAALPCLAVNVAVAGVPGSLFENVFDEVSGLFEWTRQWASVLQENWTEWMPGQRAVQVAYWLATLVGTFIRIHPFINGNGRTSRLLWTWGLLRYGVPVQCRTSPRPTEPLYGQIMSDAMRGSYYRLALYILEHLAKHPPNS